MRFSEPKGCASAADGGAGGRKFSSGENAFVGSDGVVKFRKKSLPGVPGGKKVRYDVATAVDDAAHHDG